MNIDEVEVVDKKVYYSPRPGDRIFESSSGLKGIGNAFPEFPITADFEYLCQSRFDDFHINEMGYDGDFENCDDENDYDTQTYGRYAGSYAQDEMDYSDDDIDTIFDGDPSAYWNID